MTKYFVDQSGNYIGGFDGADQDPDNSIQVPDGPAHARDKWINGAWVKYVDFRSLAISALIKKDVVVNRCAEKGVPVSQEWKDYADALRICVTTGQGPLPDEPLVFPEGS